MGDPSMRYRRVGQEIFGVLGISLSLAACGSVATTAKRPTVSTYLATSQTLVAFLQLSVHGNSAFGIIRLASSNAIEGPVLRQLSGSFRDGQFDLRYVSTIPIQSITFSGSLISNGVNGLIQVAGTTQGVHLRFARSTLLAYNRAAKSLKVRMLATSRTDVAHQRILNGIDTFNSNVNLLVRDASALGVDVNALKDNLGTEVADVASAKSDIQRSNALIASIPTPAHSSLCASARLVRTDATNVANDDQFVSGFISGLMSTQRSVAIEEVMVHTTDLALHQELGTASAAVINVSAEPEVNAALNAASIAQTLATTTANTIVANLNSDAHVVFRALNSIISLTRCGVPVAEPSPLTVTAS